MGGHPSEDPGDSWASASDLADYAFCPRAHYYRHHPPPDGPDPVAVRHAASGERYHARRSRQVLRLSRSFPLAIALLLAGGLLLLALLLAGAFGG